MSAARKLFVECGWFWFWHTSLKSIKPYFIIMVDSYITLHEEPLLLILKLLNVSQIALAKQLDVR